MGARRTVLFLIELVHLAAGVSTGWLWLFGFFVTAALCFEKEESEACMP
jgi:hypothetical protein